MCVTSLLCGPRADLWSFDGFLCQRFSLYIKVSVLSGIKSRVVSKTKHSKTKTEARSTQISKTKTLNLENEAP